MIIIPMRLPTLATAVTLVVGLFLTEIGCSSYAAASSVVPCNNTNDQCSMLLRPGSVCIHAVCSNPYSSGCLFNQKSSWRRKRVCNSEDLLEVQQNGFCRPVQEDLDYMEIRIGYQNWDSSIFQAWVLQILLSEILGVPATLESGKPNAKANFYDPQSSFDYGALLDWDSYRIAQKLGDCRRTVDLYTNYTPCVHVVPEIWEGVAKKSLDRLTKEAVIEPPMFTAGFGQNGWFIPRFTMDRDSSLISYHGMSGEQYRRKLADRFKRPTTWMDYCNEVSSNNCTRDDGIAVRAPMDSSEQNRMFVEGLYTGYFRKTEENDCDKWPTNCTGHIVSYPCGWSDRVWPITYWLKIALKSSGTQPNGGYTYDQMVEIWHAANATKSDVISMWWFPDRTYQSFFHTDSQLQLVTLQPADYKCVNTRVNVAANCNGILEERVGKPEGVCADPPDPFVKVVVSSLKQETNRRALHPALQSPAYQAIQNYLMDNTQIAEIVDVWLQSKSGSGGFSPREAVCQWVEKHVDRLLSFAPPDYPRVLQERVKGDESLSKVALTFGVISIACVILSGLWTYRCREQKAVKYAQVEFMFLLLVGLLLVSSGAVVQALAATDRRCVTIIWLINIGYTLELVPLMVKVGAINSLMQTSHIVQRLEMKKKSLFGFVASFCVATMVFLSLWTALSPPRRVADFSLTKDKTSYGETIIATDYFCKSETAVWIYISIAWQCLLLICATVLAMQTRKVRKDLNETQTLAVLIYSHFMLLSVRIAIIAFGGTLNIHVTTSILSLVYSIDSVATLAVYFVPKFVWTPLPDEKVRISFSTHSSDMKKSENNKGSLHKISENSKENSNSA